MTCHQLAVFAICFATANLVISQEAHIVVPPEAINITLNEETVFTCTAVGDHINWRVNNTPVNEIIGKGIDDLNMRVPVNATEHIYLEKLRVVGSHFSNASMIVCQSVLLLEGKFTIAASDPVLLLVQGNLEAVAELSAELVTSTTLLISWHPPYTLKGVPILFYHVKINPFLNATVENTTLYIPFEQSQVDIIIAITVVPVNRVGEGKATSILTNLATTLDFSDRTVADTISTTQNMRTTYTTKLSFSTLILENLQTLVPSSTTGMKPDSVITFTNLVVLVTAAVTILLALSVSIVCTAAGTCIIWRRKSSRCNKAPETVFMEENNPAYDFVKTTRITTHKNPAYEDIRKF